MSTVTRKIVSPSDANGLALVIAIASLVAGSWIRACLLAVPSKLDTVIHRWKNFADLVMCLVCRGSDVDVLRIEGLILK